MLPFENIADEYRKIWEQWSISKAEYEFLDEEKKTILARCSSKIEWSEATRDRLGRQDEEYIKHLKAIREARAGYLWYETYLNALKMRQEWYMSVNSTRRAEMTLR